MRCILVNGAKLKADTYCFCCRKLIGDNSYIREIGNRRIYCDQNCYSSGVGMPLLRLQYRVTSAAETKPGGDVVPFGSGKWFGSSGSSGPAAAATSNRLRPPNWFVVS